MLGKRNLILYMKNQKMIDLTPNKSIAEEKKEKISSMCERYNIGYVAKQLDIHRDTVKKYKKEMDV